MRPIVHVEVLTFDSNWQDVSGLLPAGLVKASRNGRCNLRRMGDRLLADMQLTVTEPGINTVLELPSGWQPDVPWLIPFTYWTSTTADAVLPSTDNRGYIGAGGTAIRTSSLPNPGTVLIYLDVPITTTPTTALPA